MNMINFVMKVLFTYLHHQKKAWWVGYVAHMREIRNAYKISHKILKDKTMSETRLTWENNTEMGLKYIGSEDVDWIYMAQNRVQ